MGNAQLPAGNTCHVPRVRAHLAPHNATVGSGRVFIALLQYVMGFDF